MNQCSLRYTNGTPNIPRIVSATIKNKTDNDISRWCESPRIAGDLRIVKGSCHHLRYAEVRNGSLVLYRYVGKNKIWDFRVPLYNLNINLDSPKHYSQFSLSKYGEITPLATFQVVKEQDYKQWLKILVVEVIRQTPLNTLKFLDVLFISELLDKQKSCKPQKLESLNNTSFCKKPLEVSSCRAKMQNPKASLYKNEISVSELKYQTINYDINHNKQPVDFIESDYEESKNSICSFDLNIPLYRNLKCDRTIKSSDSVDSGFCSFQSIKSEDLKEPDIVEMVPVTERYDDQMEIKPKTKLRRSDSFKSNVSSSCLNLLSKFRRISVKDNNNESSHKRDSPTKLSDPGTVEGLEKKKNNRLWDFKTRSNAAIKRESSLEQVHKIILNNKSERKDFNRQDFDKSMTHSKSPSYRNAPEEIRKARERISNFLHKNKYMHEICPTTTSIPPADSSSSRDKETGAEQHSLPLILDLRLTESVSESLDQNRGNARNVGDEKSNTMPDVLKDLPETRTKRKPSVSFQLPENVLQNENTNVLVRLLTKCQIDKEYVPVREKRLMFESLSRFSFSVDNLKRRKFPHLNEDGELVRSSSLHDLHNKSPIPVRVMKNYFESFSETNHNVSSMWNKREILP